LSRNQNKISCDFKPTFNSVPQTHFGLMNEAFSTWRRRENRWHIITMLSF